MDLALGGIVLLALALRLPNLTRPLWYDEILYAGKLGAPTLGGLILYIFYQIGSIGYRVPMFFYVHLLGENPVVLRLPSLLAGLGSLALTFALARRYTGRRAALLAALLLAFSPVHVWYSQEAAPYAAAQFLLLAAALQGHRLRAGTAGRHGWSLYTLLLIAAGWMHYYSALFLLPLSLLALGAEPRQRNRLWLSHAVAGLWCSLPLVLRVAAGTMITGMPYGRPFTLLEWWMLFFHWFLQGNCLWSVPPHELYDLGGWTYLLRQPLLLACQAAGLVLLLRGLLLPSRWAQPAASGEVRPRPAWELGLYLVCSPLVLFVLTLAGLDQLYVERFLYVLLPFFWIVVARGLTEGLSRRWSTVLIAAALLWSLVAYGALLARPREWTVYKHNPDWPAAVRYLLDDRAATERDLVLIAVPYADLRHYLRLARPVGAPRIRMVLPAEVPALLADYGGARLYLIDEWNWEGDLAGIQQAVAAAGWTRGSEASFNGLNLYEYLPR